MILWDGNPHPWFGPDLATADPIIARIAKCKKALGTLH
jgi:hypothetical protein